MPKGKTKAKCARGTTKTVVVSLVNPAVRGLITNKGTKGAKALLKRHLAVTTCTRSDGLGQLVRKASVTTKELSGQLRRRKSARTSAPRTSATPSASFIRPSPPSPRRHSIPRSTRDYTAMEAELMHRPAPPPPWDNVHPFTD